MEKNTYPYRMKYVALALGISLLSCTNDPLYSPSDVPPIPPVRIWATEAAEDSLTLNWADVNDAVTGFSIVRSAGYSAQNPQSGFSEVVRVPGSVRSYGLPFLPDVPSGTASFSVRSIRNGALSKMSTIGTVSVSGNIVVNRDLDIAFTAQPNNSVCYSNDGTLAAVSGNDGTVKVWDLRNYSFGDLPVRTITVGTVFVGASAFSPDKQYIVTGSSDGQVKLWNYSTGALVATLGSHTGGAYAVQYSADGKYIVTGSFDGTAKVWDAAARTLKYTTAKTAATVHSVAIQPNSQRFAIGNSDGVIRTFDLATGAEGTSLNHGGGWIYALNYSPDGTKLVSGGSDNNAKIWNVASTSSLVTLSGHTGWITGAAFSFSGRSVITVSKDKTVRLWNTSDGTMRKSATFNTEELGLAASPVSSHFVTVTAGTVQYWRFSTLNLSGFF